MHILFGYINRHYPVLNLWLRNWRRCSTHFWYLLRPVWFYYTRFRLFIKRLPLKSCHLGALVLRAQARRLGELPVPLMQDGQLGFILRQLLLVPGSIVHHDLPLLRPDGPLQAPLHLRGLIAGVMDAVHRHAFLIVRPELLQLLGAVLGAVDPQDDGEGGVPAVQGPNPTAKGIVQGPVGGVWVLLPLDWLVIRGAVGVGGDLPAVTAKLVMDRLADLFLQQPQAAQDVPPRGGLQGGMDPALVVDSSHALVRQVPGGLPDGLGVAGRAGDHLV